MQMAAGERETVKKKYYFFLLLENSISCFDWSALVSPLNKQGNVGYYYSAYHMFFIHA
jgi:hypothetical protein